MQVVRITDNQGHTSNRNLYHLIEQLDIFSLVECKKRDSVCLDDTTDTLFLDHLDEATNVTAILQQVALIQTKIKLLVVVDSASKIARLPHSIPYETHLVIGEGFALYTHMDSFTKASYMSDTEHALVDLKNMLTRAA